MLLSTPREPSPSCAATKCNTYYRKTQCSLAPSSKLHLKIRIFNTLKISVNTRICTSVLQERTRVCAHRQVPPLFWWQRWPMDKTTHFGRRTSELWFPYGPSSSMHLGSTDMAEKKPVPHWTPISSSAEQKVITNQMLIKVKADFGDGKVIFSAWKNDELDMAIFSAALKANSAFPCAASFETSQGLCYWSWTQQTKPPRAPPACSEQHEQGHSLPTHCSWVTPALGLCTSPWWWVTKAVNNSSELILCLLSHKNVLVFNSSTQNTWNRKNPYHASLGVYQHSRTHFTVFTGSRGDALGCQ